MNKLHAGGARLALTAVGFAVVGAWSGSAGAADRQLQEIQGFELFRSTIGGSSTPVLSYAVVLRNASTTLLAAKVTVTITLADKRGRVVLRRSEQIEGIPPGEVTAVGDTDIAAVSALSGYRLHATWQVAHWLSARAVVHGRVSIGEVRWSQDATATMQTAASARIRSSFTRPLWNLVLVAVYGDASGRVIGGSRGCVGEVDQGSRGNVGEVNEVEYLPHVARLFVVAQWQHPSDEGPHCS